MGRESLDMQVGSGETLSRRARVLWGLERWFTTVDAPQRPGEHAAYEYAKAAGSFAAAADEIGGLAGKRVLDFGCGWGGETAWLAERAAEAVGADIDHDALADAQAFAARRELRNLSFVHIEKDRLPLADDSFDAVLSTNVFEHVMRPATMLCEIRRVLRPGGSFLSTFGPLFYSPLGYHVPFATQVPFAHLLFGHRAVIEVRNTKRPPIAATSWEQDVGLNRITFRKFAQAVQKSGLKAKRLRRIPVRRLDLLAAMPVVGNLFTFGVDCHLVNPHDDR